MATEAVIPARDYSDPKYDPPRVPWWVLFIIAGILNVASSLYLPRIFRFEGTALFYDLWAVYVCLWMRRLNPTAMSILWAGAALVFHIAGRGLELMWPGEPLFMAVAAFALIGSAILNWIGVFRLRMELHWHYNEIENEGLKLGPFMTFFFTYLYFQYHLAEIADRRSRMRSSFSGGITG